jgi:Zn-dependent protease with chaperone function
VLLTVIENFVLFSSLLALASFLLAGIARRASLRGWWRPQPYELTRLYGAALVLPPVLAAWVVTAAFLPEWLLAEAVFGAAHPAPVHNLHLLSDLTATLEPKLAYATLLFAVSAALFAAWTSVRGYNRVGRLVGRLKMNAAPPPAGQVALVEEAAARHGLEVGLVMSDYPLSFVWGYRRTKLVLSSGLLGALTPEELGGVLEHEAAHHRRLDNIVKLALSACGYASIVFPLSRLILKWRSEQVELVCDEVAAARTSAPLEIADALVKLRRRTLAMTGYSEKSDDLAAASGFVNGDAPGFQRRVRRLIAFSDAPPSLARASALAQTPKRTAVALASLFVVTLAAVNTFAPLAVHRLVESFIRFLG